MLKAKWRAIIKLYILSPSLRIPFYQDYRIYSNNSSCIPGKSLYSVQYVFQPHRVSWIMSCITIVHPCHLKTVFDKYPLISYITIHYPYWAFFYFIHIAYLACCPTFPSKWRNPTNIVNIGNLDLVSFEFASLSIDPKMVYVPN